MQRQLLQIADKIPDDITLTILKSFAKLLSREPEPAPKTPFIRAFAKMNGTIDKSFSVIAEEDEEQLKHYESSNSEGENECTFNYKVTASAQQVVYGEGSQEDRPYDTDNEIVPAERGGSAENLDEGIEMEMPKLLPADADIEDTIQVTDEEKLFDEIDLVEAIADNLDEPEEIIQEAIDEIIEVEEPPIIREPTPTEAPKVSLDDIEREIQEMQKFLFTKGVKPEKKVERKAESINHEIANSQNIEDAYLLDFCVKLRNRSDEEDTENYQRNLHNKYLLSENYKEEITEDGPIFDPAVPNTPEDFMKVKSVSQQMDRKKQKVQALDMSWMNVMETQRKLYRWEWLENSFPRRSTKVLSSLKALTVREDTEERRRTAEKY